MWGNNNATPNSKGKRGGAAVNIGNVVNPGHLFGNICKKSPQFRGYQQQDAHELLRHLLDSLKTEEIKVME